MYAPDFALLNYDAAITMGIAACEVDDDFFSAADVFNSVVRLEFQGASGHVVFDNFTGTRLVTDVRYTVQNLLSSPDPNNDEIILLESITSAIIDLDATDSDDVVEIVRPFVYAGNTTNQPPPLPAVEHNPYLIPNWALGLGLLFCVTMMAMSIGWCAWTLVNRKQRMVRASQPFFLVMLCIGTFLIASSIIPTSFQEPMSEIALNVRAASVQIFLCYHSLTCFICRSVACCPLGFYTPAMSLPSRLSLPRTAALMLFSLTHKLFVESR